MATVAKTAKSIGELRIPELKAILQKRRLPTTGNKTDLINRLQEADPHADWVQESELLESSIRETDISVDRRCSNIGESASSDRNLATNEQLLREIELMERERQLMQRELRIAEREIEILRATPPSSNVTATETRTRIGLKAVSELLKDFDGSDGSSFQTWESEVKLLIESYELDANAAKILIGTRLKGNASVWYHSRPEHLRMSATELLVEMSKIFDRRQSRLKLRRQFEERKWRTDEEFSAYVHEKVIFGNLVSVDKEELLEYVIDGIPDIQLRNQARLQRFNTTIALLTAFEGISLADRTERVETVSMRSLQKEKKIPPPSGVAAASARNRDASQAGIRCFNCSKYGHKSTECKLPRREKGACFKCGEKGHLIYDCKDRQKSAHINCVQNSLRVGNTFEKTIVFERKGMGAEIRVKLDTLIDTGSSITLIKEKFIPNALIDRSKVNGDTYCGINGSKLNVLGVVVVDVHYNRVVLEDARVYVVPENTMTTSAILGRDCIDKFKLKLTDPIADEDQNDCISEILKIDVMESGVDLTESLSVNSEITNADRFKLEKLFETEYVFARRPEEPQCKAELKLQVKDVQPFTFSPRRLSFSEKGQLRKILDNLIEKKVIRSSESEFASPIVMVRKKNGEHRMCIDYRTLNKYIARDNYPIPIIEDQLNVLKDKKYFSSLDLKDGFFHISMSAESIKYTAFTTPFGQFEFLRMPFGLKPAPTRFQRYVNEVISDLIRSGDVVVYIDDFLIATETIEHHFSVLKRVFRILVNNKLDLRLDKCKFLNTKIEYLGYVITAEGIKPTESGIEE
ncbi:uncharacterized protein LOC122400580 [Colletes gigas]|uniref:uncharacterized protein LOC122400580 n=1 Tax=Colletes gigas TaxID=935657 RepID=UPI001C9BA97A|nr:uncharacterized protein LOC122400580 [Colletes gigas]